MDKQKTKRRRKGKVIRCFTVEVVAADANSTIFANSSNSYSELSDEDRLRDFVEMFSVLWAESCREASQKRVMGGT